MTVAMTNKIIKRCNCCQAEYTREGWEALPFIGYMAADRLELRNCACGSSIAIQDRTKGKKK